MTEKDLQNQNPEQDPQNNEETPNPAGEKKTEDAKSEEQVTNAEEPATETGKGKETAESQEKAEAVEPHKTELLVEAEDPPPPAHDDFDWDADKKELDPYSKDELEKLETMYDSTFKEINENEIVDGKVVGLTENDVILNIGFKSDGLVPRSEFRDIDDLKVGQDVEVYVVRKEDERGQLLLSRKNAKLVKAWDTIVDAYENEKVLNGRVISKTKGGLIADVLGMETFLPGSQIDVKPILDYDAFVGKTMDFKVVKINEAIKNAVVSHKALIESDIEEQRSQIISTLEKGQVLEGTVKNITDFGAFIDLGGVDGLLYITDISWGRINHPSEVLELNQTLNVVVLEFDDEKKRISLGLKQLQEHPWETLDKELEVGSTVKGKVVNIEDYGAFIEITPGVEGLVHISEVSWSYQPVNSKEFFKLGDEHEAKVMTIDREERKMSLSIKRLKPDPWEGVQEKFPLESKHTGMVKNITPYGVFIELAEGIGGMVHISDLSWTKRYNHPSEVTKVGDEIEVVVLEIDEENRKLSLGHKQIEEDPWDTFEEVFPVDSAHEGTVLKKDDKGAVVLLPYGLEGFCPVKHLKKEDNTTVAEEEQLDFVILEFDRNNKRILLSHTNFWKKIKSDEEKVKADEADKQKKAVKKTVSKINKQGEKSTLGDIDALSELKEKMDTEKPKAKKAEPKAKKEEKEEKEEPKAKKAEEKEAKAETDKKTAEKEEKKTEEKKTTAAKSKKKEEKEEADKAEEKAESKSKDEPKADSDKKSDDDSDKKDA